MSASQAQSPVCSKCGGNLAPHDVFCTQCGHERAPTAFHSMPCGACGTTVPIGHNFCQNCGQPLHPERLGPPVKPPKPAGLVNQNPQPDVAAKTAVQAATAVSKRTVASADADSSTHFLDVLRIVNKDRTGALGAIVVVFVADIVCLLGSIDWFGWPPFAIPGRLIGLLVRPGNCGALATGTFPMYFCSAKVAGLTLAGPIAMFAFLIYFRKWVALRVRDLTAKLPESSHFLVAPVAAAIAFAFAWVPVHYQVNDDSGLVSQRTFPAIVACFTYASTRYGYHVQTALAGTAFFQRRDKLPKFVVWVLAALIPLALSLIVTFQDRVSGAALKEQMVTLVALCTGYLAFTPRQGSLLSAVERAAAVRKQAQRARG